MRYDVSLGDHGQRKVECADYEFADGFIVFHRADGSKISLRSSMVESIFPETHASARDHAEAVASFSAEAETRVYVEPPPVRG